MNTTIQAMRRRRLDKLLERWGTEGKLLTFQAVPLPEMTREELMAVVASLNHRITKVLNRR